MASPRPDPSPLSSPSHSPAPYSDHPPHPSDAGPSQPSPAPVTAADPGLPQPSQPYAGAAAALAAAAVAAPESPQDRSRLQRLRDADPEWLWKTSLRAVMVLAGAIGLAGSAVLTADRNYWSWGYGDEALLAYAIVSFAASFVWCTIVLLVPLLSRQCRPVHPGVVVAIDLVFWFGLIFSLGITIIGYSSLASNFSGSVRPVPTDSTGFGYYNDNGGYAQAANGTWVYTSYDADLNYVQATPTATATATTAPSSVVTTTPSTTPAPAVVPRATTTASSSASDGLFDGPVPTSTTVSVDPYDPYQYIPTETYDPYDPDYITTMTRLVYSDGDYVTRTIVNSDGFYSTVTAASAAASASSSSSSSSSSRSRLCSSAFASCADQDAYVNRLYHHTDRDTPLALMASVLLALLLLLHFVLFVWACVDTHRYNRRAAVRAAFDLGGASGIALLENLRQHGYVMVPAETVQGAGGPVPLSAGLSGGPAGGPSEKAPAAGQARFA